MNAKELRCKEFAKETATTTTTTTTRTRDAHRRSKSWAQEPIPHRISWAAVTCGSTPMGGSQAHPVLGVRHTRAKLVAHDRSMLILDVPSALSSRAASFMAKVTTQQFCVPHKCGTSCSASAFCGAVSDKGRGPSCKAGEAICYTPWNNHGSGLHGPLNDKFP